jgi:hypothetical protein
MSATLIQSILWIATLGVLVLFVQRRRKRRSH